MRIGVYPGTFNPPTLAHLAIAEAARAQRGLDSVVLMVSVRPINKESLVHPTLDHRLGVLRDVAVTRPWLDVATTHHRLLVDIAEGFDVVIMGADKWAQVNDPQYYDGDPLRRNAAVDALPQLAIAPRSAFEVPRSALLNIDEAHHGVSSTGARVGQRRWMCPEAIAFDELTGAWSDPDRYSRWLASPGHRPG